MSKGERKGSIYNRISDYLHNISISLERMQKISEKITNPNVSDDDRQKCEEFLDDLTRYLEDIQRYVNDALIYLLDCIEKVEEAKIKMKIGFVLSLAVSGYGIVNMLRYGASLLSVGVVVSGVALGTADIYYIHHLGKFKKQLISIKNYFGESKYGDKKRRQALM